MPNITKILEIDDIFNCIIDEENIYKAYAKTQKGDGKYKKDAMIFASNETYNLKLLKESLVNETYEFGEYTRFKVYEPKERIVDAPTYVDKIVQVAINNVLKEIYYPSFIYDSFSCIDNKGTHLCVKRIQKFMKKAKWQHGSDAYIIKIDIKKFFYSIERNILKDILPKKIKSEKALKLLNKIIDSANSISSLGLPLGNTLSQIGANIYMDRVDQYAKRKLSIKHYARYADDIFVIVESKEVAIQVLKQIVTFIKEELDLEVNIDKTKIFPINQGINGVGFKIHTTHILLRNDTKKKIKRRAKSMSRLISEGRMTKEKAEQMLNSWKGHADYACNHNFIESLINRNSFIYKDNDGKLKIDIDKIREGENHGNKKE